MWNTNRIRLQNLREGGGWRWPVSAGNAGKPCCAPQESRPGIVCEDQSGRPGCWYQSERPRPRRSSRFQPRSADRGALPILACRRLSRCVAWSNSSNRSLTVRVFWPRFPFPARITRIAFPTAIHCNSSPGLMPNRSAISLGTVNCSLLVTLGMFLLYKGFSPYSRAAAQIARRGKRSAPSRFATNKADQIEFDLFEYQILDYIGQIGILASWK